VNAVVLKMGDRGCFFQSAAEQYYVPAFPVEAVDTTGAGDTFNAALAIALAAIDSIDPRERSPIFRALRFASAAAAIGVTRSGAQTSPTRAEVDRFFRLTSGGDSPV
jgi:ribokinase